jgi:hypothetical protein
MARQPATAPQREARADLSQRQSRHARSCRDDGRLLISDMLVAGPVADPSWGSLACAP